MALDEKFTTVLASITSIMTSVKSSLEESFFEAVLQRLDSFGYTVTDADAWSVGFAMQKVENHIKNACNTDSVPYGLTEIAVDRVCGEFLYAKMQMGQLANTFDLETAVKTVATGDTSVTFALGEGSQTAEQKMQSFIAYLTASGDGDFICYRQIKW